MKNRKQSFSFIEKIADIVKLNSKFKKIVFLKEALEIYSQEMTRKFDRRVAIYNDRQYGNYHEHTIKHLVEHHGHMKIKDVDKKYIMQNIVIPQRQSGLADKTIRNRICSLRSCLRYLSDMCMLDADKLPDLSDATRLLEGETPRTVYLKPHELDRLVYHCNKIDRKLANIIIFYVQTGLRKNELLSLKWQDVDMKNKTIHVRNAKNSAKDGNSGKDRVINMSTVAINQLKEFAKNRNPNHYVFSGEKGKMYAIDKNFIMARKMANLDHIRIHDLRRTFGSWRLQGVEGEKKKLTMCQISKILGHSDIRTTQKHYAFLESGMIKL